MAVVKRFNVNEQEVTLDADIIENMSANDVSYNNSFQYNYIIRFICNNFY